METKDDGSGAGTGGEDATERKALWSQLKDLIGADVMSELSVPVFIMEPTTMLQKMSEILQYATLLDAAADEEDEESALAEVLASARERRGGGGPRPEPPSSEPGVRLAEVAIPPTPGDEAALESFLESG